jgi:hypothetical protein
MSRKFSLEEIIKEAKQGAADGINASGDDLAGQAIAETPVEEGTLRASARYPANDSESAATPNVLEAQVSFNTPYAAAQHEGQALQHRQFAVKPDGHGGFFTDINDIKPHTVLWVVKNHPGGGKSHYLSDPLKAMVNRYEQAIARSISERLDSL